MTLPSDRCRGERRGHDAVASPLALAGVVTLLSLCALSAEGAPGARTIFSRLQEADSRAAHAARAVVEIELTRDKHEREIVLTLEEIQLTRRACESLRRELVARHIDWERALRTSQRRADRRLARGARLRHELLQAAPQAFASQHEARRLVGTLDRGEETIRELVGRHGALTVRLAQQRAAGEAAERDHAETLERAKETDGAEIERDLDLTGAQLGSALGRLEHSNPSERDFHRFKGTLSAPVRATPSHRFGRRARGDGSSYVRHTGLTYEVESGTSVRAAAGGRVVAVERFEGFGLIVIIDHASGYHSVYAHLSEASVEPGDQVDRGDSIASSGESGSLDGAKLYFELRERGEPIDPTDWFLSS